MLLLISEACVLSPVENGNFEPFGVIPARSLCDVTSGCFQTLESINLSSCYPFLLVEAEDGTIILQRRSDTEPKQDFYVSFFGRVTSINRNAGR